MKKLIPIMLALAVFLCACEPADTMQTYDNSALNACGSVLLENTEFMSAFEQVYTSLSDFLVLYFADSGADASFSKFALADLDSDGADEVVLEENVNGITHYGFLVLHYENDTVYGHQLYYRGLNNLKEDGTFSYSGGAADNGFGRLIFSESGFEVSQISYCESSDGGVAFYVDGVSATAEEYFAAQMDQLSKTDAVWYDYTEENLAAIFSQ